MTLPAADIATFATHDGLQLEYRVSSPAGVPRAGVLIVHGFAEHGLRYRHLVDGLVPAGYACMTYDARGHGRSAGRRVFVERFDEYVADLAAAIAVARRRVAAPEQNPERRLAAPLFVFAHSMGGLVAIRLLQGTAPALDGVVFSNPSLTAKVAVPPWKVALAKVASRAAPGLAVPTGLPAEHISRDQAEVAAYRDDPLVSKVATARWYTEFLRAQVAALSQPTALAGLPVLALIGDGDQVIDPAVGLAFFERVGGSACTIRRYPGYYHELLNEPEAERRLVIADIIAWFDARSPQPA
ncbi:MAG: alpha/beta hydrolase [Myxococcales bacterium]|nr:alpha/beta hydrolase [Myxococcales bacterium]